MTVPAIEIRQLKKRYRKVDALRGLDITVDQGSVCGFLGPNGAGKTTTMKILMGLVKSSSGWAAVLGNDVSESDLPARARIGYLPQDPVFPRSQTVRGVVASVARLYPDHPRGSELRRRVDDLIDRVGMTDKARRRVHGLSGGERQRLGVAQALVGEPDLVILDEPSAGLDPMGRRDMLRLIEEISSQATVFYSTHILDDVERISDTVVMISRGQAVAQGSLEEILTVSESDYAVRLRGETSGIRDRLTAEPWVGGIDIRRSSEIEDWRIRLTDESAADRLVPLLASDDACDVIEFHLSDRRLEDAYLELVGADDGD
ncbi:MAG: ABC transporter ATP-binding protein [Actinomycetota bacterium]|nr:ABC transporter ATP-binding protein [Actinomycetota bacterium]